MTRRKTQNVSKYALKITAKVLRRTRTTVAYVAVALEGWVDPYPTSRQLSSKSRMSSITATVALIDKSPLKLRPAAAVLEEEIGVQIQ